MVSKRSLQLLLGALGLLLAAGRCGGGDGDGGDASVTSIESPDLRCAPLPDEFPFPPGYDLIPGRADFALVATFSRALLVPFDVARVPFELAKGAKPTGLPSDADGDGAADLLLAIDDVFGLDPDLALVTTSGYESVIFVDPAGGLRDVEVSVPGVFDAQDFRALPAPGESRLQSGFANFTCLVPPPGLLDSRGAVPVDALSGLTFCRDGVPSFRANFTAGAAVAGRHLFVAVSNLGADRGSEQTQFLPGAVTVYDLDLGADPPAVSPTTDTPDGQPYLWLHPGAFNATHVQAYTTPGGRDFVLATLTGAIGIRDDDPNTSVLEGGAVRRSDGAVDVIDASTLRLVATIPLRGANPSFRGLALHAERELALVGDVTARQLYALDLSLLETLPVPEPGEFFVLDGSDGVGNAVLFDGLDPFRLPALPGGAPEDTCPGWVESAAWNGDGSEAFAIDACDGSLATLEVLQGTGPVRPEDFRLATLEALTAPLRADTAGLTRLPAALRTGPADDGPNLFFLVGEPEGLFCGIER